MADADHETVERDRLARYQRASEFAEQVRIVWENEGMPLTAVHPNGMEYEAPLCKLLREAERDAARLARDLPGPKRRPGPPPAGVLSPSLGPSPAQLRRRQSKQTVR